MMHMAESVANHVAASLEIAVGRAMNPLTQSLDTFIKCATREQVDGVRRIVGQFVQQMNSSLGEQLSELGDIMRATAEAQRDTQKNLHNTMAAVQNMSHDAQIIEMSTAQIAEQIQLMAEKLEMDQQSRCGELENAQQASVELTHQLEQLSESLRYMQHAVDALTEELNGTKTGNMDL